MQGQTEGIARADSSEWDGMWGFRNWLGPTSPLSADSPCYRHSNGATEISFAVKCDQKWIWRSCFGAASGVGWLQFPSVEISGLLQLHEFGYTIGAKLT